MRLLQPKLLTAKYSQRPTYTQSTLDTGLASPGAGWLRDGMVCDANAHEFIVRFPRACPELRSRSSLRHREDGVQIGTLQRNSVVAFLQTFFPPGATCSPPVPFRPISRVL